MATLKHRIYHITPSGHALALDHLPTSCPTCGKDWTLTPVLWGTQDMGKQAECSCGARGLDADVCFSKRKAPVKSAGKDKIWKPNRTHQEN